MNFALMQYHKYSLSEIENMMPWEKEVYTTFLVQYLEELKQKQEAAKAKRQWQHYKRHTEEIYQERQLVFYGAV